MHILKILISLFTLPLAVWTYYFLKYRRTCKLQSFYEGYLLRRGWDMHEHQQEIISLFKSAGLQNLKVPFVGMIGPTHESISLNGIFDGMMKFTPGISHNMHSLFCQAKGVYKKRMRDSVNPFYWLEIIIFLPQKIVGYLGFNENSKTIVAISKTLKVLYWIFGFAIGLLYYFNDITIQIIS
jgi:hypothetical protein